MACLGGALAGGGADEDEAQMRLKLVGEFFQGGAPFLRHRMGFARAQPILRATGYSAQRATLSRATPAAGIRCATTATQSVSS
jgi:hypothetical protein